MSDQQPDSYVEYIGTQVARYEPIVVHAPDRRGRMRTVTRHRKVRDGLTPPEAILHAIDRDTVALFRDSVRLVMLCNDDRARAMPVHTLIHQGAGLTACAGPQLAIDTAHSLGISDQRARYLIVQMLEEDRAIEGLQGSGTCVRT